MSYDRPTPAWIPKPKPYSPAPKVKPYSPRLTPLAFCLIGGVVPGNLPAVSPMDHALIMHFREIWDAAWREGRA